MHRFLREGAGTFRCPASSLAPVAQRIRATGFYPAGRGFESSRGHITHESLLLCDCAKFRLLRCRFFGSTQVPPCPQIRVFAAEQTKKSFFAWKIAQKTTPAGKITAKSVENLAADFAPVFSVRKFRKHLLSFFSPNEKTLPRKGEFLRKNPEKVTF